ncbi:MAG: hypothetical protein A2505_08390 [Deltaproteobacteria bacterium RIFOXYD12_FULL_55_16]|nr:MAG: hypothetical protein A2505_08390 [Deltaproteobacteria bacterium RIFOXYD12_FULL_55_16]
MENSRERTGWQQLLHKPLFHVLLIAILAVICYGNTFHVPFIFDDLEHIRDNGAVHGLANYFSNVSNPNRFVCFFTFALNYQLGGLNVIGYHLVNLLIHIANALLVYSLVQLIFLTPYFRSQEPGKVEGSGSAMLALFAALLFVVHPVQTQAVTYIYQRLASMATMFYLLAVVLYVWVRVQFEAERPEVGVWKQGLLIAGSVLAAMLAMKTKELSVTLPFVVFLLEFSFFRGDWRRRLLFLLPLLLTIPIVPLGIYLTGEATGSSAGEVLSDVTEQFRVQTDLSRPHYLFTQLRVIVTYLRLLILPVNQNLDYDYPVYTTFFTPPVFLSFLLLAALFSLAVYLFIRSGRFQATAFCGRGGRGGLTEFRSLSTMHSVLSPQPSTLSPQPSTPNPQPSAFSPQPSAFSLQPPALNLQPSAFSLQPFLRLISFGILWFFMTLSVESSLIPIADVIFEHRLYLPMVGAVLACAAAFFLLFKRFFSGAGTTVPVLLAALIIVGFGWATVQRNQVWGDSITLWQDTALKSPAKVRPYNNLGAALNDANRLEEAMVVLLQAVRIKPDHSEAWYNLGRSYILADRNAEAVPNLERAVWLKPDFGEAYANLAAALNRERRFQETVILLERNLNWLGKRVEVRFNLGVAYVFLGNLESARNELAVLSRLDPALAAQLANLLNGAGQ